MSSLFTLVHGCPLPADRCTDLLSYRVFGMSGSTRTRPPGKYPRYSPSRDAGCCLPGGKPVGTLPVDFRGSIPSRSASPVTLAPRLLSCLRINQPVTALTARLDTGPVASVYPGGSHTHQNTRHCQAAADPIDFPHLKRQPRSGGCRHQHNHELDQSNHGPHGSGTI
jgi:hypothetical protein